MRAYLRSLNPQLPRDVWILQAGGLANMFGNGVIGPFLIIYLHNVRGISLGIAGLVVATGSSPLIPPIPGDVALSLQGSQLGVAVRVVAQLPPAETQRAQATLPGGGAAQVELLPPDADRNAVEQALTETAVPVRFWQRVQWQ